MILILKNIYIYFYKFMQFFPKLYYRIVVLCKIPPLKLPINYFNFIALLQKVSVNLLKWMDIA